MEGRPVERQLVVGGDFKDLNEAMRRMEASPEARRLLESMGGTIIQEMGQEKSAELTRKE